MSSWNDPKIPNPLEMLTYLIGKGELIGLTRDQLLEDFWVATMASSSGVSKEEIVDLAEKLLSTRNNR